MKIFRCYSKGYSKERLYPLSAQNQRWKAFNERGTMHCILIAVFIPTFLVILCGAAKAQTINITVQKAAVKTVLQDISQQAGYKLLFNNKHFQNLKTVSIFIKDATLKEALDKVTTGQPITYDILDKTILIKPRGNVQNSKPSIRKITGHINDENGKPIAGANVQAKGSPYKTKSLADGTFVIELPDENQILQFSFVGYVTIEREIQGQGTINVTFQQATNQLEEFSIVSTGYQNLPKERATGSFVQIDNALLNRRVSTGIIDRLEGNVPGLLFNKNTSGSADGKPDINIRGHSTLFANDQPLIVVDNFPYDGNIDNINPNDIESITVLKDAAAASIWGVRSGNGVIVITTKKGKRNQDIGIEFNANVTVGARPDLYYKRKELISSNDRIDIDIALFKQGYFDNALNNSTFPEIAPIVSILDGIKKGKLDSISGYQQINALRGNDVRADLQKYFYQKSINQQYALSLKGGTTKADYYFSAGYDRNRNNNVGNDNTRVNLSSQMNFYPLKNLSLRTGFYFTQTNALSNNVLYDLSYLTSVRSYSDLVDDQTGEALPVSRFNPAYIDTVGRGKLLDWQYRPYDELKYADNRSRQIHNRISTGLKYKIIDGLSADFSYQLEKANTNADNYNSLQTYYARDLINRYTNLKGSEVYPIPIGGILNATQTELTSQRARAQVDYSRTFASEHNLVALAGAEINETVVRSSSNTRYGYNRDNETTINVDFVHPYPTIPTGTATTIPKINGTGKTTDRYLSYFGNASYTFQGKYILSLSGRIDKSNLFGVNTNQKAVPLYSAGLAWDFSRENFYNAAWLPYGKLRLTYGYNGNIDKSASALTTFQIVNSSWYYGVPNGYLQTPGNPELRWEKVRIINLGLDFGIKDNLITGSLEGYIKNGKDLFGYSTLPGSTGLTSFYGNTANITTKGFDIALNSRNLKTPNWQWTSNLQLSRTLDIVTKYNIKVSASSYISGMRASIINPLEGKALFAVYSYRWGGLTHDKGDPQGYVNGQLSTDYPAILAGTTVDSMVYNGPARPTVFGSFRNTISYKQLSLSFNILYKFNYFFQASTYTSSGAYGGVASADYYKRWQQPGDEFKTNIPSLQPLPIDNSREMFYTLSEAFVERGDHIRLQDISLQYDLGLKKKTRERIMGLQVYCYANNLGILWRANDRHIDPDIYAGGYPNPLSVSLGLKAKF